MAKISVVVPNLNGGEDLVKCLDSLTRQSLSAHIIVIDNASTDNSVGLIESSFKNIEIIKNDLNLGFAGGVNVGIKKAFQRGDDFIALLNNDAVAEKSWLETLAKTLQRNSEAGIVTSKIIDRNGKALDSTGEFYTIWGLSYPRGRNDTELDKYDKQRQIFGASGGASLYRAEMLKQIGLFDKDFFAYYEDVDLSFRAQLAGWKVLYEPSAVAYHKIGATSSRMSGFSTYQTLKNLPMLYLKNMPTKLFWQNFLRFKIAYWSIFFSAVSRGQGWPALKGLGKFLTLLPKKLVERFGIQRRSKLSPDQVSRLLLHDLPPDAHKLRAIRNWWRKLTGRRNG